MVKRRSVRLTIRVVDGTMQNHCSLWFAPGIIPQGVQPKLFLTKFMARCEEMINGGTRFCFVLKRCCNLSRDTPTNNCNSIQYLIFRTRDVC